MTRSVSASAIALASRSAVAQAGGPAPREFYELRKYKLQNGAQTGLAQGYFADALIPGLNRLGFSPVGAFSLEYGPETPAYYVLVPGMSVEALVTSDLELAKDAAFLKAAAPFWSAPAAQPPFVRIESSLMQAFEGRPKLTLPPASAPRGGRMFQLRTYESPTNAAHVRKVEMFNSGEYEIFERAGFWPVFYGDTLIGPQLPQLTYMLSFTSLADMTARWSAFTSDPAWKKLSSDPRYAAESIVSSITNLVLSPLACSQI
ncbi:MAG TPA: NIPSNAP family protein [Acidisarcina sp.]